ncbi:MAG: sigma-54-dependent Fis family transcriptional regulator, partial [Gammaproteobacteria bacterium]|nr:sigma-54-dependent Fis family transcriptional regulator [Gammaproteobacteria bacterium]
PTVTLKESMQTAEHMAILRALSDSNRVIHRAADMLGISRKNLWEKMKRYGIEK